MGWRLMDGMEINGWAGDQWMGWRCGVVYDTKLECHVRPHGSTIELFT